MFGFLFSALCGVLTIGCTFAISPVAGILSKFFGLRTTAMMGGTIGTIGMIWSSFVVENVSILCFTYGILYGLGASLAYTPSLAILGHYFRRYLGIVNGVVSVGSSVFTVIFPPLMEFMIKRHGLDGLFLVLAIFTFGLVLCGATFEPLIKKQKSVNSKKSCQSLCRIIFGAELWKRKPYKLWAICIPIAMCGYFVPYVHIKKYIEDLNIVDTANMNLPLQGLAITSAVGRVFFGYLSDKRCINKIVLQQISYFVMGVLTIILGFTTVFWLIVLIALGMGLCEGGLISLIGPIAFELCGHKLAAQGIGCVLGITAYPMSFGPPLAALIYIYTKTYTLPFILSGIMPIVGASLMFLIHLYISYNNQIETHQLAISLGNDPLVSTRE